MILPVTPMATNDDLARMMAAGFAEIQEHFEKVDERFEVVGANFHRVFSAIATLQGQITSVEVDIRQLKREIIEIHKVL